MKILSRLLIALALAGGFLFLFLRSADNARSEPYTVERRALGPLVLQMRDSRSQPVSMIGLRPPQELAGQLFDQIFTRMMESLRSTSGGVIPIVLRSEYELALASRYTPEALLEAARSAGLESSPVTPVCVGVRRQSEPGLTRQLYFAVLEAPAIVAFRRQIGQELNVPAGAFEPDDLSPVLLIGGTDADLERWLPLRVDPSTDCMSPIQVQ
jgi:hypothetical protein